MQRSVQRCIAITLLVAGLALTPALATGAAAYLAGQRSNPADIAIVVHSDTPVTELTIAEVRKIFLGEQQYWSAKLPVVLLIRAPAARERDVVLRVIYEMTEPQFKRYWIAKIFRAEAATAPKTMYSNQMALELVTAVPGAIAFVDSRDVKPGVKVLRVDGHKPGEEGYPLR
ncbi:MAG: substrate-binding domain-containing protein [Candidatus Acidiferrales bacterium]